MKGMLYFRVLIKFSILVIFALKGVGLTLAETCGHNPASDHRHAPYPRSTEIAHFCHVSSVRKILLLTRGQRIVPNVFDTPHA